MGKKSKYSDRSHKRKRDEDSDDDDLTDIAENVPQASKQNVEGNSSNMESNSKIFNDAIHGLIEVHPLAVKIIDTPQFQRLRFIKQVGSTYFVYPSASHNRFEHSLGVYHLAGELVTALKERQPELKIDRKDVLCVQIAGLCHDLGHGPYSHLWEMFMRAKHEKNTWKHEDASVKMLDYLIEKNHLEEDFKHYGLQDIDLIFIKRMIKESPHKEKNKQEEENGRNQCLYQIVANAKNGIDVDKWDYFLRDGLSLGIQVSFKYSRLLNYSRAIRRDVKDINSYEICYRDKEQDNIYDMFRTRMMLHKNAYNHRVVKTVDLMLIDALLLADEHITYIATDGEKKLPLSQVVSDMHAMTHLNDDVINQIYRSTSIELAQARQIIQNLFSRRLYPVIGLSPPTTKDWGKDRFLDEIKKKPCLKKLKERKSSPIRVSMISLNYSQGPSNPLLRVGFFTKENPDVYKKHLPNETSRLLPEYWEEKRFLVACTEEEEPLLAEAKQEFLTLFN